MGNYEMDFESDHIRRSTGTPRPERVEETTAGLLARGLMLLRTFPAESSASGIDGKTCRLQLRGQPRFWSLMGTPHRVPF